MKVDLNEKSTKVGGKESTHNFNLEISAEELAMLCKCSPALEKFIVQFADKMADEQVRHNKAYEELENKRLEYQKERDEKDRYWKSEYEKLQKSAEELGDKLQDAEHKIWEYETGINTPVNKE